MVVLEHGGTRGPHLCLLAAYAPIIDTFNSVVTNLLTNVYLFERLIAVSQHPL